MDTENTIARFVADEFLVLRSIYPDLVEISTNEENLDVVKVKGLDAGDPENKHSIVTLIFALDDKYPKTIPTITVEQEKGLSDAEIKELKELLDSKTKEMSEINPGYPILFELIEFAKEFIMDHNTDRTSLFAERMSRKREMERRESMDERTPDDAEDTQKMIDRIYEIWNRQNAQTQKHKSRQKVTQKYTTESISKEESTHFLSHFQLLHKLGEGGFGQVWKAQHSLDRKFYAIKQVEVNPNSPDYNAFISEAANLASLEHPNIVRYYNSWVGEGDEVTESTAHPDSQATNEKDKDNVNENNKNNNKNQSDKNNNNNNNTTNNKSPNKKRKQQQSNSISITNGTTDTSYTETSMEYSSSSSSGSGSSNSSSRNSSSDSSDNDSDSDSDSEESRSKAFGSFGNNDFENDLDELDFNDMDTPEADIGFDFFETSTANAIQSRGQFCSFANSHMGGGFGQKSMMGNSHMGGAQNFNVFSKMTHGANVPTGTDMDATSRTTPSVPGRKQHLYLVMEFCAGRTLRDIIDTGFQDDEHRWKVTRQVLSALAHIHKQDFVHRDLKPANIFLDSDGNVKIGDFGLACATNDFRVARGSVGTALYRAPEQCGHKHYDEKVDMYALGVIMYEIWHGPFGTDMERRHNLKKMQRGVFPSDGFPADAKTAKMIVKLLIKVDPDQRPTSKAVMESDLLPLSPADETFIDRAVATCKEPTSAFGQQIVKTLFSNEVSQALELSYDQIGQQVQESSANINILPTNLEQQLESALCQLLTNQFALHGSLPLDAPMLAPKKEIQQFLTHMNEDHAPRCVMMDPSSTLVQLPRDLTESFARFIARQYVHRMKRYSLSRVFRRQRRGKTILGGRPKEMKEADFDIVVPLSSNPRLFGLCEAEVIGLTVNTINELTPDLGRYDLFINHYRLLNAVLDMAQVPHEQRYEICRCISKIHSATFTTQTIKGGSINKPMNIDALSDRFSDLLSSRWNKMRDYLLKRKINQHVVDALAPFFKLSMRPRAFIHYFKEVQIPEWQIKLTMASKMSREDGAVVSAKEKKEEIARLERCISDALEGLQSMERLMRMLTILGLHDESETRVLFDLGLVQRHSHYTSGIYFQAVLRDCSGDSSSNCIADGGRYDELVAQYYVPARTLLRQRSPKPVMAVGVRFAVDKIIEALFKSNNGDFNILKRDLVPIKPPVVIVSLEKQKNNTEQLLSIAATCWKNGIACDLTLGHTANEGFLLEDCRERKLKWVLSFGEKRATLIDAESGKERELDLDHWYNDFLSLTGKPKSLVTFGNEGSTSKQRRISFSGDTNDYHVNKNDPSNLASLTDIRVYKGEHGSKFIQPSVSSSFYNKKSLRQIILPILSQVNFVLKAGTPLFVCHAPLKTVREFIGLIADNAAEHGHLCLDLALKVIHCGSYSDHIEALADLISDEFSKKDNAKQLAGICLAVFCTDTKRFVIEVLPKKDD